MRDPYFLPKLYLSARISPDAHQRNNRVASYLTGFFDVFLPHHYQSCATDHTMIGRDIYEKDIRAMELSDICLLLPPYGRDCACEIGWYQAAGKPVYVYTEGDLDWLRDCMVKGGVEKVFTSSIDAFRRLTKDPIIGSRVRFVLKPEHLGYSLLMDYHLKTGNILIGA